MKNFIQKRNLFNIIKALHGAVDFDEIRRLEDQLAGTIIAVLTIIGCLVDLVVRLKWQVPLNQVIITALIFLSLAIIADMTVQHVKNDRIRSYILSLVFMGVYLNAYFSYYDYLGIVLWTGLFVLILISVIRTEKSIFVSLAFTGMFLILHAMTYKTNEAVILDRVYYLMQIALFIGVFIIGFIWNTILTRRLQIGLKRYHEAIDAKEEITQLFEEVTATEEELRQQNEQLHHYNQEIRDHQERLNYMAYNDTVTGIANRKFLIEKIELLVDTSATTTNFAVVFIDLDDFKKINDTMGHHIGDLFLQEVARRLDQVVGKHDTIARFGGDEFAILLQHDYRVDVVYETVEKMRAALSEAYNINDITTYTSASFGIATYPTDGASAADLIKAADMAMYKAKAQGKNTIEFFKQDMHEEVLKKIAFEQELVSAIRNEEFYLVYQPQFALDHQKIIGFEALIRWQSPKRGIVYPLDFIPLLEEMKAIVEVGEWVIHESCKKIQEFRTRYPYPLKMSINVSPLQMDDELFIDKVRQAMTLYDIKKGELELEITEGIFIANLDKAIEHIKILQDIGVTIALDDFGTGYSSLSYLRKLPLDVLKIDKSFIWDLEKGERERKIVSTLIELVHDLDIKVIAEGVETAYQKAYLEDKSCDQIQGYLISKPLDEDQLDETLKKYT